MANICLNFIEAFGESEAISSLKKYLIEENFDLETEGCRFTMETRWSPDVEWVQEMSEKFKVLLECEYEECSSDIGGKFAYDKGKLVFDIEMSYLEHKYHTLDWNEFLECEVAWRLDNDETIEEFIANFTPFCSDEEIEELNEIFFEYER